MTPEERVEKLITVDPESPEAVLIEGGITIEYRQPETASVSVNHLRALLRGLIDEAAKEARGEAVAVHLASVVPEGPVGERRLEEIRGAADEFKGAQTIGAKEDAAFKMAGGIPDLLAAYDHLRSLCARLLQDDPIGQYQAGLEQGRREERRRHAELLRSLEWSGDSPVGGCCPECRKLNPRHADDCPLAALLKEKTP